MSRQFFGMYEFENVNFGSQRRWNFVTYIGEFCSSISTV